MTQAARSSNSVVDQMLDTRITNIQPLPTAQRLKMKQNDNQCTNCKPPTHGKPYDKQSLHKSSWRHTRHEACNEMNQSRSYINDMKSKQIADQNEHHVKYLS